MYKPYLIDSKYVYMVKVATNWIYRKKRGESDVKLKPYSSKNNFISYDEEQKEIAKLKR